MEITYTRIGEHWLPDIILSDPPDAPPLGKYGRMHKRSTFAEKNLRCTPPCCSQSGFNRAAGK